MQQTLTNDFNAEEIREALFQMGPTKGPGPDGMNALFYKKFWPIVGDSVVSAVLEFLNNGHMLPALNHTHIVLIPKINNLVNCLILDLLVFVMLSTKLLQRFRQTG